MADSRLEAEKDGVRIPTTVDDYVVKRQQPKPVETSADLTDIFYDTTDDDTGDWVLRRGLGESLIFLYITSELSNHFNPKY